MGEELMHAPPAGLVLPEREQAALLEELLRYSPQLTQRQRRHLVASIMRRPPAPAQPATDLPSGAAMLLRPGIVQAEALALNYTLLLGLAVSGSLQYAALPLEATLLAVNYLVLTGLMMALSLLCLVHALVRWELRPAYRALVIAMGVTGAFGMLESLVFTAPWPIALPLKVLFLVTVPLLSVLIALTSMWRVAEERAAAPADPTTSPKLPPIEE